MDNLQRKKATVVIHGDVVKQYNMLKDYALSIIDSNPGSTVIITTEPTLVDGEHRFDRIYIFAYTKGLFYKWMQTYYWSRWLLP